MNRTFIGSAREHERSLASLAGGVATAIRAAQRPVPVSFVGGSGPRLTDIDGNEYVDFALAYGPMLLGHSPAAVIEAVHRQLDRGLGYGASHPIEPALAEAVCRTVPSAELCAFSNTGSEAVHAAIRIARAATGRRRVIKFQGHYHGWLDPLHIGVGASLDPREPGTAGQDPQASASIDVCAWNDVDALRQLLDSEVAAVIMEPVAVNRGCLSPAPGYLEAVQELTSAAGALLIFDEVITGFRLALGGAQQRLGVTPDMTILGKAMGGGFPISAVCGRADVMSEVASGRVSHMGTFNANPICGAAALAAIETYERNAEEIYPGLDEAGFALASAYREAAAAAGVPLQVNQLGAAGYAYVATQPVSSYEDTLTADPGAYVRLSELLLEEGIHVIPRGILYTSTTHTDREVKELEGALDRAMGRLASELASQEAPSALHDDEGQSGQPAS
ncbi:MAG: glutamate-semialdehyde--aminomutase [Acidimicrobiaceae bacterium]|nr:glutamate-semialdehyde--aminomutase [Acidimicrobiaceae bacterium]